MPALTLRAGRCTRRGDTRTVDPEPARGLIQLDLEDGLLHFQYKDLASDSVVDDLILFPGDATFSPVSNASRVYCLRFTSSSARHFYWLQDPSSSRDKWQAERINQLIDDPDAPEQPFTDSSGDAEMSDSSNAGAGAGQGSAGASSVSQPPAGTSRSAAAPGANSNITPEQMAQLQALVQQTAAPNSMSLTPTVSLADILAPSRLLSFLKEHPEVADSLYSFLPPESPEFPHNLETLRRVFQSPELRKSAKSLDSALTTAALAPLAPGLSLREEETFGVDSYLRGVQRLGDEEKAKGNNMQTD